MLVPHADEAVEGILKPKRVRHGQGQFQDGDNHYIGSFHEDCFEGNGTFKFASGSVYSGMWKQGQYWGQVHDDGILVILMCPVKLHFHA